MENLIRALKEKAGATFTTIKAEPTIPKILERQLKNHFQKLFKTTKLQFQFPTDFFDFIQKFGDEYIIAKGRENVLLYSWHDVLAETKNLSDVDFMETRSKKEVWITIGEHSDKYWYYLCCDPTSENFGKVADGEDNSPWNQYDLLDIEQNTFKAFLESLL